MAKIVNPNAAGIDIASKEHYVAVPEDRTEQHTRSFLSFTRDLHELADWLKDCGVDTVVMESTGVYWFHLFTILQEQGFQVHLVNARHVKNVPGRKSDISDARWLQQLHSFGLLNGCFQPDNLTRELRSYIRQRKQIIQDMSTQTQRMQKALEQMNIKVSQVIRDIHGKTGRAIIKAIIKGERSAHRLAENRDPRIKCSEEVLIKSLEGNWREEQLFNLKMAFDHYLFLEAQMQQYDAESEKVVQKMQNNSKADIKKKAKTPPKYKHRPGFDVANYMYQILGVDVTQINGVSDVTVLTVLSETGVDLKNKFPSEKQFLSWANLVPDNKISGGKVLSSKVRKRKNKAGQAFRDAASSLWRSQSPLGDYLRRKKAKSGSGQAVIATARKIASIYYTMVTNKVEFDAKKIEHNAGKYLSKKVRSLEKRLAQAKTNLAEIEVVTS